MRLRSRSANASRRTLYEQLDRPALKPLPAQRYEMADWKWCTVNIDYHVEVDHHYYSVQHQLLHTRPTGRTNMATEGGIRPPLPLPLSTPHGRDERLPGDAGPVPGAAVREAC